MLHSLDFRYINPNDSSYREPKIHIKDLNNLDAVTDKFISKSEITDYYNEIKIKITAYTNFLNDTIVKRETRRLLTHKA